MDSVLKEQMDHIKRDVSAKVDELTENVKGISDTVNEISFALMGNKFTKDGGIIGKIIQMDTHIERIEERVAVLEEKESKNGVYVKTLWIIVGAVGSSVLYMLINFVLSLVKH